LDSLKAELAAGRPVIIWATYDMKLPGGQAWVSSDGVTSVVVQWQHTFVAVGYDEIGVYLVDAYDAETKHFSYEAFVPGWEQLGRIAVTAARPAPLPSGRTWNSIEVDGGATGTVARSFIVDGRWIVGPE
jgi:hypothetical protein